MGYFSALHACGLLCSAPMETTCKISVLINWAGSDFWRQNFSATARWRHRCLSGSAGAFNSCRLEVWKWKNGLLKVQKMWVLLYHHVFKMHSVCRIIVPLVIWIHVSQKHRSKRGNFEVRQCTTCSSNIFKMVALSLWWHCGG